MPPTKIKNPKNRIIGLVLLGAIGLSACNLPDSQPEVEVLPGLETATVQPEPSETFTPLPLPTQTPTALPTETAVPINITFPDPADYDWASIAGPFEYPLDMTFSPDGTGKLYIAEKSGLVWQLEGDYLWPDPFINIQYLTDSGNYESGLLGITFHPDYVNNGYFFTHYTDLNGNTVIARFQAEFDADQIDPTTQKILFTTQQPYHNHNGGQIAFGPDGYLYIALGDGGSGGDPLGNGQNTNTPLGAILRIDVDNGDPYAIPPDNPFANGGGLPEIWVYGLRNPWRFSFDRQTGDMFIADVGQNTYEEINYLPAGIAGGSNLGWNYYEGNHAYQGTPPSAASFVFPAAEYTHNGGNCTVVGGVVYRGQEMPEWNGVYIYGDYCSGVVWGLLQDGNGQWQSQPLFSGLPWITSFAQDQEGNVYMVSFDRMIYRLTKK